MFHDQHVLTNGHFSFFMSCPAPPMGISSVGSFPLWTGVSLIIFQLLMCRNLALNRFFFSIFLRGRHVLYLGVVWTPPTFVHPHMFVHALYVHMPPRGVHSPYVPHTPVHLYVLRGFCILWGVVRASYMLDTSLTSPVWGCLPLYLPCTHSLASLCIGMFWGHLYVIWGIFPVCWGFGGDPIYWDFGGISTWNDHVLMLVHSCSSLCLTLLLWLQLLLLQLWWCFLG